MVITLESQAITVNMDNSIGPPHPRLKAFVDLSELVVFLYSALSIQVLNRKVSHALPSILPMQMTAASLPFFIMFSCGILV